LSSVHHRRNNYRAKGFYAVGKKYKTYIFEFKKTIIISLILAVMELI
jgi:hypothetical protein